MNEWPSKKKGKKCKTYNVCDAWHLNVGDPCVPSNNLGDMGRLIESLPRG